MSDHRLKLGSHMSIAGGYYKAVEAAAAVGCDCVQLFTKNNNQWKAKPISDDDAERFQAALQDLQIVAPLSHASYLINLASPDSELRDKSVMAFAHELERASQLAIPNVVVHPGAFTTSAAEEGLRQIADSLDRVFRLTPDIETRVLLENTAGQGSTLGWQFEQLAWLMQQLPNWENRLGVCIDTCHAFAAGYPLSDDEGFAATIADIERTFGIENIHALHLNDSKKPLGSRVDRHEHIGVGEIGLSAFSRILNHPKLRLIPMYLETEKGENPEGRDWDIVNLERLRACVQHSNKMA